jgi:Zn-dependent peptidase ImmA (M78 family)/DNA-binding XRE family transcriptional regulator
MATQPSSQPTTLLIGARIKALREERKLSQDDLARLFGFKDRQTISAIETGERKVSAEELILAVEKLGAPLDYFTNPFVLVGEGKFNWRQMNVSDVRISAYERSAGRWIAAFRTIAPQVGRAAPLLRRALGLTKRSTYEDAMAAGERFAAEFALGDVPATRLAEAMERELGVLVLMVEATDGVSGAACRLPELDVILINRHEVAGRRHFDLAHELFHILTWDAMPPEYSETASEVSSNRVEQLANNFASALLMPAATLDRFGDWSALPAAELPARLNAAATELQVSSPALKWRLVALDRLKLAAAKAVSDATLRNNGRAHAAEPAPPALFSRPFMEVLALAIDEGRVSARRAAGLLDLTIEDLGELFAVHGVASPVDL